MPGRQSAVRATANTKNPASARDAGLIPAWFHPCSVAIPMEDGDARGAGNGGDRSGLRGAPGAPSLAAGLRPSAHGWSPSLRVPRGLPPAGPSSLAVPERRCCPVHSLALIVGGRRTVVNNVASVQAHRFVPPGSARARWHGTCRRRWRLIARPSGHDDRRGADGAGTVHCRESEADDGVSFVTCGHGRSVSAERTTRVSPPLAMTSSSSRTMTSSSHRPGSARWSGRSPRPGRAAW